MIVLVCKNCDSFS